MLVVKQERKRILPCNVRVYEMKEDKENEIKEESYRQETPEAQYETFEEAAKRQIRQAQKRKAIRAGIILCCLLIAGAVFYYYKRNVEPNQKYDLALAVIQDAEIGDIIVLGTYDQDSVDGKDDVQWLVLDKRDSKYLLTTQYCLWGLPYNTDYTEVTWETSTIRKWLNEEFIYEIFNEQEIDLIEETQITTKGNDEYSTQGGNDTLDKLFLLSAEEVEQYFDSEDDRVLHPTWYAERYGINVNSNYSSSWWWLRTPGNLQDAVATVDPKGTISMFGHDVSSTTGGLRPALWIDISEVSD